MATVVAFLLGLAFTAHGLAISTNTGQLTQVQIQSSGQLLRSERLKELDQPALRKSFLPNSLFCFAVVRSSPPEPTSALLAKQLDAACDAWALYGDTADPANNVTKAFSKKEERHAWKHEMREMVTLGAYKHIMDSGALDKYEWFLKVDADSFVRPSTLRKSFAALKSNPAASKVISVSDGNGETQVDGFFIAVHTDAIHTMQSLGWPEDCDPVLSGHSESRSNMHDPYKCLRKINVARVGCLRDTLGHRLVALDQDDAEGHIDDPGGPQEYGPKACESIGQVLVDRAKKSIKGPLCECTLGDSPRPACVGEDFVAVHHVKDAHDYAELAKAFP
jgi:hypothetical protein